MRSIRSARLRRGAALFAVVAMTAGVAAAPAAAVGGTWTIEPSVIMQKPTGDLGDISCVVGVRTRCMAVGAAVSHYGDLTSTTQLLDGSWHDTGSPHRPGTDVTELHGVSCTAALTCMAVGDDSSSTGAVAAQWTPDSDWRLLPIPTPATARGNLNGVACPAADACFAVGSYWDAEQRNIAALVETWNGSRWTLATIPSIAGSALRAVSCTSLTSCVAVGSGDGHLLALRWDGATWTTESMPEPPGSGTLYGVSCATARSCMAVGERSGDNTTLAERWDGTSWSITDTQDVPGALENQLADVSCVTMHKCVAVGSVSPYNQQHTLVESWDGTSWQLLHSPNAGSSVFTQFEGVSCTSVRRCLAVGTATGRDVDPPGGRSFIAYSNGDRWKPSSGGGIASGNATGAVAGRFSGLSCANAEDCVAVGATYTPEVHLRALAQVRTADGWRVTPTPQGVGFSDTLLAAVSCPAANACMAVGQTSNQRFGGGRSARPFTLWWNGTSWQPTDPIEVPDGIGLLGVSCVTPNWCVATGETNTSTVLIETWDGTTWTTADIAPLDAYDNRLTGISCVSKTSCVAVGDYTGGDPITAHQYEYAAIWDGASWRTEDFGVSGFLTGVSCSSATFCAAVGSDSFARIWNGSSWSSVPMPKPADGVSCVTRTSCVAVSQRIQSWNGTRWLVDPDVESSGSRSSQFSAVSCVSATGCAAAGIRGSLQEEPLIESTSG